MKAFFSSFFPTLALGAALILFSSDASAQKISAKIGDPKFEVLPSPDVSAGISKRFKPKDWLEMEVSIKMDVRPEPKTGYLDKASVTWYVLIKNPERSGTFLLLQRTISHVNIPEGEEIFASAYLSPATIRKMSGGDRAAGSIVESVGVEVAVNGRTQGVVTTKKFGNRDDWWNLQSPKVVPAQSYKLLKKDETPFKLLWWDRYLELDPEGR